MTISTGRLRLNQGDASEARIYYCAHFVADALGYFRDCGVEVVFTRTQSGGHTIQGGQIPAVLSGEADLTIGGPMVTMKNYEDGGPGLVSFCAAVRANPWFLAAARSQQDLELKNLAGARIIDVGNVGTANLTFRWLLERVGIADTVSLVSGSGNEAADIAAVERGDADYAFHSLHALAPYISAGGLQAIASLAQPTGPVPWSAYIARPEIIAERRNEFTGFTKAIGCALSWIRHTNAADIADLVAPHYPDYPTDALALAVDGYKNAGVFAANPLIAREDFDHFASILREAGWLTSLPPYDRLVDTSLAEPENEVQA